MRAMRGKTLETVPFQPYSGCTESFLKVLSNQYFQVMRAMSTDFLVNFAEVFFGGVFFLVGLFSWERRSKTSLKIHSKFKSAFGSFVAAILSTRIWPCEVVFCNPLFRWICWVHSPERGVLHVSNGGLPSVGQVKCLMIDL